MVKNICPNMRILFSVIATRRGCYTLWETWMDSRNAGLYNEDTEL